MTESGTPQLVIPAAFERLRQDAIVLLTGWGAPSESLEELRARLQRFAESTPECMWRDGGPVHFTASLVVLDADLSHVALTLHGKAKRWFQFGGHLEAGDTDVAAGALREGLEESGNSALRLAPGLVQVDAQHFRGVP